MHFGNLLYNGEMITTVWILSVLNISVLYVFNGIWQVNKNNNHFVYVWHVLYENFGVDWISVLFLFGSSVCWINVCVVANMELIGNNMLIFILNNLF